MSNATTNRTTHTPGPWGMARDGEIRSSHTAENKYASEYVATLMQAHYRFDRMDERTPNARLIAAAPELLEALEELRGVVNASGKLNGMEYDALRIKVNNAIAKAKRE